MGPTLTFSSTPGRVLTAITAAAAGLSVVVTAVERPGDAPVALFGAGLVALLVWAAFWRPAVVVSDGEVVVRNVWRTTRVPWTTYRGVDSGLSLVLRHTEGSVTAWAAPGGRDGGTAASVEAAVRERHEALVRAGYLQGAERARVSGGIRPIRAWHGATLGAAAALLGGLLLLTAL